MSRGILQDIIDNFKVENFTRFCRAKNDKFQHPNEPLHSDNSDFGEGKILEETQFPDGNLTVCSFLAKSPLSERSGKKAQYELGKKILKESQTDAGIFIFYDKSGNFRFSLIYANYLGKSRDWSTFRRFTYFVSKELTNKTFLQRIGDGDFSTLAKIKEAFSVEKVTKEFYEDIANWYFWAVEHCRFPKDAEAEENGRNIAVIRLITRIIFIWFMRERGLVPKELFEEKNIQAVLKNTTPDTPTYYRAILQNLFFATLSTKKEERQFRDERRFYKGWNKDFGNQYVYRYHDLFASPEKIKDYFGNIPFLNGGLFECLDDGKNNIYIDGFTERKKEYQSEVPNFLFFSGEKKADLNSYYGTKGKNYKVWGLLNILSSFNFTIDENSPDDADIALDPELLGRVFENLLASFNPETSTTARKATGSYYTPREIVDYMVTESLKDYFKSNLAEVNNIDDKLENIFLTGSAVNPFSKSESKKLVELIEGVRIVDPAVGSGAFPMGVLNRMVFILGKIDPGNELWEQAQLEATEAIPDPRVRRATQKQIGEFFKDKYADYGRKLYLIQKCIYGVDIQQIAVEIAKLRFFISLLVDEKIDKSKENWGIEPLPNLDFKIMQGNSLISEFLGIDFDNGKGAQKEQGQIGLGFEKEDDTLIKEFERKKIDFQNESDKGKKAKLENEVEDLMIKIFETKVKKHKADYSRQIEEIERKYVTLPNRNAREKIIAQEKQKLSQKTIFDLKSIEKQLREFTSKNKTKPFFLWKLYFAEVFEDGGFDIVIANPPYIKEYVNRSAFDGLRNSPYYQGKMDIWYLFACRGIDLSRKNSGLVTFIAQNNWVTSHGASKMRNKVVTEAQILSLIDFGAFKIFEAGIQTMVVMFKKNTDLDSYSFDYRRLHGNDLEFKDVIALLNHADNDQAEYLTPEITRKNFINKIFTFSSSNIEAILEKIAAKANFYLDPNREVAQGIVCPQDYVNKASKEVLGANFEVGEGIFILSDDELKALKLSQKELSIVKPFYTTDELHRWWGDAKNKKWIIYTDSSFKNKKNIKEYPAIKEHLDRFRKVITSDNKPYGLHRARDEYFFKGAKVFAVRKCARPAFTYTEYNSYVTATFYAIKTERINQKYLTGLLNSQLIAFWLKHRGKMQGTNFQIDKEPIVALPILKPNETSQDDIAAIVTGMINILGSGDNMKQAKVRDYEKKIDQLIYKLYGLTPEEITIVENS